MDARKEDNQECVFSMAAKTVHYRLFGFVRFIDELLETGNIEGALHALEIASNCNNERVMEEDE